MNAPPVIDSRAAFADALRWGFASAIDGGARRITCVDPDFADWPLDDAGLLDRLTAWLRQPLRKLVLLAADYDDLPRRCPRFVAWRRSWAHAVEPWTPPQGDTVEWPTVLVDDRDTVVRLVDRVHWRGQAGSDARDARLWRDRVDAVLQRSEAAFPVNALGL